MRAIQNNDKLVIEGTITEAFPGAKFKVELQNGHELTGYASGKIRQRNIRILLGDRVKVELTPYDLERGRITYRYKRGELRKTKKTYASPYAHV